MGRLWIILPLALLGCMPGGTDGAGDDVGGVAPAAAPDEQPAQSEACCRLAVSCSHCGCEPAVERLAEDDNAEACAEILDREPAQCRSGIDGANFGVADAIAFCLPVEPIGDYGQQSDELAVAEEPEHGYWDRPAGCDCAEECLSTRDGVACTQTCEPGRIACPGGDPCLQTQGPWGPYAVCMPAGAVEYGGACSYDADCATRRCWYGHVDGGVCATQCRADDDCPGGSTCHYVGTVDGGSCVAGLPYDALCDSDDACASGLCNPTGDDCGERRCGWPGAGAGECAPE